VIRLHTRRPGGAARPTGPTCSTPSPVVADAQASPAVFRRAHRSVKVASIVTNSGMTIWRSGERQKYPILGMHVCVPCGRVRSSRLSDIRSEYWGVAVRYGSVEYAAPRKSRPPISSSRIAERSEHSPYGPSAERVLSRAVPIDRVTRLPAHQGPRQRGTKFRRQRGCSTLLVYPASPRR
jgi:hypothetical protein